MSSILSKKVLPGMLDLVKLTLQGDLPLKEFLKELDQFNHRALPAIRRTKLSEGHAKAILIKLSNLAVAKFHYLRHHSSLVSQPFGVLVDPSNHSRWLALVAFSARKTRMCQI
jgi:hypothetical protein